ncbi:hypothetical protein MXD81_24160, partial [Microbacteriaceae bacterium K1510]|nr:hypothetical protein [Microbacteriaceae bacterium K1510]
GYYFARYGVVTPQVLAGGATPGLYLNIWYIWLIDPDIGLFPNWPFGLLLLGAGALLWSSTFSTPAAALEKPSHPARFWTVCAVYL